VLVVLQKASLCRTNGFDLIAEEGWQQLAKDIAEDFPNLTLAELNSIIKQGYKGLLDKYKSLPLNYTRIYQWVVGQAPRQPSAFRDKFPELFAWADLLGLGIKLVDELTKYPADSPFNESLVKTELRELIGYKHENGERGWTNGYQRGSIHDLLGQFQQVYPAYVAKHAANLY
jgi:hypothetical protein